MQNFLENLWFNYEIEKKIELSDSERGIVNSSSDSRDKIYSTLTPEQKADFESYEDLSNEICLIYEKEAFIKGVKFTAAFLSEAIK
ncbi:MAG: hypothetical protein IJN81_05625 [Clostridia bacterium]|nr:hypothetical protein [Clostridia bacterium]